MIILRKIFLHYSKLNWNAIYSNKTQVWRQEYHCSYPCIFCIFKLRWISKTFVHFFCIFHNNPALISHVFPNKRLTLSLLTYSPLFNSVSSHSTISCNRELHMRRSIQMPRFTFLSCSAVCLWWNQTVS